MKKSWVRRAAAGGDRPGGVDIFSSQPDQHTAEEARVGRIAFSGVIAAGGKGFTRVTLDVGSPAFKDVIREMFYADRDAAIRAFGEALVETQPINPVDVWQDHGRRT